MYFLLLGVLLGLLKLLDIGPPAAWSWWVVLTPFVLAIVWWAWADWSGHTRRKEMDKMDERKAERRRRNMVALGMDPRKHDKQRARYQARKASQSEKIEKARSEEREKKRVSVISSHMDGELAPRDDQPGWSRSKQ